MGVPIVPEFDYERMPIKCGLNDAALNAATASVDKTNDLVARRMRGAGVFVDDGRDVLGGEGVQVELPLDRHLVQVVRHALDAGVCRPCSRRPPWW